MYQNAKTHIKHHLQRNRITLSKTSIFSVFGLVTQKTKKNHVKYHIRGNEKDIARICIMGVFELKFNKTKTYELHSIDYKKSANLFFFHIVRYENGIMHAKNIILRKETIFTEFRVFMSVLCTNTLKSIESTLYAKIKQCQKLLFSVFLTTYVPKTSYLEYFCAS